MIYATAISSPLCQNASSFCYASPLNTRSSTLHHKPLTMGEFNGYCRGGARCGSVGASAHIFATILLVRRFSCDFLFRSIIESAYSLR